MLTEDEIRQMVTTAIIAVAGQIYDRGVADTIKQIEQVPAADLAPVEVKASKPAETWTMSRNPVLKATTRRKARGGGRPGTKSARTRKVVGKMIAASKGAELKKADMFAAVQVAVPEATRFDLDNVIKAKIADEELFRVKGGVYRSVQPNGAT